MTGTTTSRVRRATAAVAAAAALLATAPTASAGSDLSSALSVGSIDQGSVNDAILQSSAALGASPGSLRSLFLCVLPRPSTDGTCLY